MGNRLEQAITDICHFGYMGWSFASGHIRKQRSIKSRLHLDFAYRLPLGCGYLVVSAPTELMFDFIHSLKPGKRSSRSRATVSAPSSPMRRFVIRKEQIVRNSRPMSRRAGLPPHFFAPPQNAAARTLFRFPLHPHPAQPSARVRRLRGRRRSEPV
jgi:hypothetical protein